MAGTRLRGTRNVVRKELRAQLNSPTIYIVAAVFVLAWEFLFFRDVFLVGQATLRGLFDILPWLLLLLVPALTMGSISQERRDGTLELLLTHPVRDRDVLIGKFASAVAIVGVLLAFTLPIAFSIDAGGRLDWGEYAGQVLAALLLGAALAALGTFVSALLESQVAALLVAVAASFAFIVIGSDLVTARLPLSLGSLLDQLSLTNHFRSMSRGVLDLRDVWYFASFIAVFLGAGMLLLLRRRYGGRRAMYRRYQVAVALFVAIAILTNVVGSRIPGRIDLTQDGRYSVSDATKDVLGDLDDVVRITLYASSELPAQLQPVLRDAQDLLRDYDALGGRDLVVQVKHPKGSKSKLAEEARSRGVQEVQFNVVGNEEFKLKQGFLGATVAYGGEREVIPFIQDTGDLEYQLTSLVTQLTVDDKPTVGILVAGGAPADPAVPGMQSQGSSSPSLQALQQELRRQFETRQLSATDLDERVPKEIETLVIAGPGTELTKAQRSSIRTFLDGGGSALMLVDGVGVDLNTGQATKVEQGIADLVERWGVTVQPSLAYDLRGATTATFGGGGGLSYAVPYALWPRTKASQEHPTSRGLESVSLQWASPLSLDDDVLAERGLSATTLLRTSDSTGVMEEPFNIDPQRQLPQDDLKARTLGVAVAPKQTAEAGKSKDGKQPPRIVVIGDSDFAGDQFAQLGPGGIAFAMQAVSWLSQAPSLAAIKVKGAGERQLTFEEDGAQARVRWGNMIGALVVIVAFATWRLVRRRRLSRYTYVTRPPKVVRRANRTSEDTRSKGVAA